MPIYAYACESCEKHFDKLVKRMGDETTVACPACGSTETSRELTAPAALTSVGAPSSMPAGGGCGRCQEPGGCGSGF